MDSELQEIISPRQLRHSPERDNDIIDQNSSQTRELRAHDENVSRSRIPPPTRTGLRPPSQTAGSSLLRTPSGQRLQAHQHDTQMTEQSIPRSGIKPPRFFRPQTQGTPAGLTPTLQKVIPLPGSTNVLAKIPMPSRIVTAPIGVSKIPAPPLSSTSLLPKPSFTKVIASGTQHIATPKHSSRLPSSRPSRTPSSAVRPATAPETPSRAEPMTPIRRPKVQLPRTAVKQRVESGDTDGEVYRIAGRDVEFVDWAPSPTHAPTPQTTRRRPASRPKAVRIAKSIRTAPSDKNIPIEPKTPVGKPRIHLPRTAVKQRMVAEDSEAEIYNIAGRNVQFVDWVPSPEEQIAPQPIKRPVVRPGGARIRITAKCDDSPEGVTLPPPVVEAMRAMKDTKIIHEFPDEPTVAAAKEFAFQIDADVQRFRDMGADMTELKRRKSAILSKVKTMYDKDKNDVPDVEAFRTKYGVTQSPKMRQLLEVTSDWNRAILERQELVENLAQAQPFIPQAKPKISSMLQSLVESPDRTDLASQRRSELELAKQDRIDKYRQRKEADQEFRRILDERRKNLPSRRPYSKEEREDIRKRYQEAQEWTYTAPTEEELDNALRMAEMMELDDAGVSVVGDPEKTVEALFPDAAPSVQISSVVGDIPIPKSIPTEEINNINNLDRSTAEVALKASIVPVPKEGITKKILEASIKEIETTTIEPVPQKLDPMFEIDLKLGQPRRKNYIQLHGSSFPQWFPGFFSIFPGAPGLIKAMKSPSATLHTAFSQMHSSANI